MTGFATPPSTIRTISLIRIVTTHFKCDQRNFIISQVEYTRTRVVIRFQIKRDQDYSSPSSILFYYKTCFSQTNSGLERAASNLGFQISQIACDLKTNANANTQRIVDVLNNHWQSDLQQRYNDARLELSQQKQNATLIAALKTTAAA